MTAATETAFADWLKSQRDAVPLTQSELAEILGCSVRAIQTYEAGTSLPRPKRRRKIAAYFDENGKVAA